jgi:BirA family biotin operon repressor/biotin-[acetyl-CoA-carboxylase] ligase
MERSFGLATKVKWPNDLLHERRKLAGVLCEARSVPDKSTVFLVGVGINANQQGFSPELSAEACSLIQLLGREVDLPELLEASLTALSAALRDGAWRSRLEERLCGLGSPVTLRQPASGVGALPETLYGVLRGVADDGALLLEREGQIQIVYNGELRLSL